MTKTQQRLCDAVGIARSTLYSRMRKNGLNNKFRSYNYNYLIGWVTYELTTNPIRRKHER